MQSRSVWLSLRVCLLILCCLFFATTATTATAADEEYQIADRRGFVVARQLREEAVRLSVALRDAASDVQRRKANEAFTSRWWKPLVHATFRGDDFAEFVLRHCDALPHLDRQGIASDCSRDKQVAAIARARLHSLGFHIAAAIAVVTSDEELCRASSEAIVLCRAGWLGLLQMRRNFQLLSAGHAGLVGAGGANSCPAGVRGTANEEALAHECERLLYLTRAVANELPRFYANGLIPSNAITTVTLSQGWINGDDGSIGSSSPYMNRQPFGRADRTTWRGANFESAFYDEVDRLLQEIESSITEDMRREPRLAELLAERLNGKLYRASEAGFPGRPPKGAVEAYNAIHNMPAVEQRMRQRWKAMDIPQLLDSLTVFRIEKLHWSRRQLPLNMQELLSREGHIGYLREALRREYSDSLVRFNLVILLGLSLQQGLELADDRHQARAALAAMLLDSHPWVRVEALSFSRWLIPGTDVERQQIERLLQDESQDVRQEAHKALLWMN